MKAAIYQGKNTINVIDVPRPIVGEDEVLLKIHSVGICGTDLHIYAGGTSVKPGTIIGHEFSGEIVEAGTKVTRFQIGQRVVAEHVVTCQQCFYCLRGQPQLCLQAQILGMDRPGALAEFVAVPERLVYAIPDGISYDQAALIEPLTIAVYATAQARTLAGQKVAVIGQGPIGILLDQVLLAAGAHVIGIDTQIARLDFVRQHGWANDVLSPVDQNFPAQMTAITTVGVDSAFEAVGKEATAELCIDIARRDGDIFLLGVFEQAAKLDLMKVVKKELNIYGSWTCAFSFPPAIALVAEGKVDVQSLITHRYTFDQVPQAFSEASIYSDNRVKTIITI